MAVTKGRLPGPRAAELVAKDEQFTSPSYTRSYPFVMAKGRGVEVWDVDGNRFLDFAAGIAVVNTGHNHPNVVNAIKNQLENFIHISSTDFYIPNQIELAEMITGMVPMKGPNKVFFGNSGTEATEGALKLAHWKTRRPYVIPFIGGFHGRTMGALSISSSKAKQKAGFFPILPGVFQAPYPNCYRCQFNLQPENCGEACVNYIEDVMFHNLVPAEEVACFFIEPIQGEGGYNVPPDGYFQKLRALADKYGILLVVDEIQSGMGRTGKMFAIENWGVQPDIMAIAKGIASGMPLGCFVAPAEIMSWGPGAHGNTFGGNPLSCAAAIETIKLLKGGVTENAGKVGAMMKSEILTWMDEFPNIGDVRGKGMMIGIDFVKDRQTKEYNPELRDAVVENCYQNGVLVLGAGFSALRLSPPLVLDEEKAREGLGILKNAIAEAVRAQ
jgi:4-aminobutyrate aminotransferase